MSLHRTLHEQIRGYIDVVPTTTQVGKNSLRGWCFHQTAGVKPVRVYRERGEKGEEPMILWPENDRRPDVAKFYNRGGIENCGFETVIEEPGKYVLQMMVEEEEWRNVFVFDVRQKNDRVLNFRTTSVEVPSFVVVDNIYEDPDSVREFALSQDFREHPSYHKGRRTDTCFRFPGLKERFEQILGAKITNWEKYGTNGCFQYCIAGDQLVYHQDTQEYAGVLFLTPDAPPETGTQFFRSRLTKKMTSPIGSAEYNAVFKGGFLDKTAFDAVDTVGNVYNRVVLFDAHMIHAATEYFGTTKETGRLFQLFFFDIDRSGEVAAGAAKP